MDVGEVRKIEPRKRPASPPALDLGAQDPESQRRTRHKISSARVIVSPLVETAMSGPEPPNFWILQHAANPHLTYLVSMKPGETQGCFVYFLPYMFCLDRPSTKDGPTTMPCVKLSPAPPRINVTAARWWANATFPSSFSSTVPQYFPAPNSGFQPGDYVSLKHTPGAYACVSAVFFRTSGEKVYLVCAVVVGQLRLLMKTRMEVEGPEFTFVPPVLPLWSQRVFPVLHAEEPDRLGFFERPDTGFDVGDPVTVFAEGGTAPIDAKITFVWKGLSTFTGQYNVELPGGKIVLYDGSDVLGPRVDRLNADMDPTHLTSDPALMRSVEEAEALDDAAALFCDEEMQAQDSPSGVFSPVPDIFTTPVPNLMGRNLIRSNAGVMEIPHPGALINAAAQRIRARDEHAGGCL